MNSVEEKLYSSVMSPKKILVLSKKLGSYNTPGRMLGSYNGSTKKKLGHYNC